MVFSVSLENFLPEKKCVGSLVSFLQHLVCVNRELVNNYISCAYSLTPSLIVKFLV